MGQRRWIALAAAAAAGLYGGWTALVSKQSPREAAAAAPALASYAFSDYDAGYRLAQLRGWDVIVNGELLAREPDLIRRALALLDAKLGEVEGALPRYPLRRLQRVPIWIEGGVPGLHGVTYHWSAEWLSSRGYNPEKARSVEIVDVRQFLAWAPTQPSLLLHELGHAFHDRVLGEDNEDIAAAYDNARRSGLYGSVRRNTGETGPAYALTNRFEYFAELTEAYFGVNDFFPFRRDELRDYDPEGYALIERLWR